MIEKKMKESRSVEFKTSLFYTAGNEKSGEDQIGVIVRTLAAFMNSEGGALYIGLDDKGTPSADITAEFKFMNHYPAYQNSVYSFGEDGYKRFIQEWVLRWLGIDAVKLLTFEFFNEGIIKVCKITAAKSVIPIWFNRVDLYVRCDASTRRLREDDVTRFYLWFANINVAEDSNMSELVSRAKSNIVPSAKAQSILVVYPNGDYVYEKSGKATMVEVIRRAGIHNVIALDLAGRKGNKKSQYVPFIGKEEYRDNSGPTQTVEGEYFIFSKYSTGDLIDKLNHISLGLGLGLHIEKY